MWVPWVSLERMASMAACWAVEPAVEDGRLRDNTQASARSRTAHQANQTAYALALYPDATTRRVSNSAGCPRHTYWTPLYGRERADRPRIEISLPNFSFLSAFNTVASFPPRRFASRLEITASDGEEETTGPATGRMGSYCEGSACGRGQQLHSVGTVEHRLPNMAK